MNEAGGPAFPTRHNGTGMTLRDYFAAKAMQSMASDTHEDIMRWNFDSDDMATDEALAKAAYLIADAMLYARHAG